MEWDQMKTIRKTLQARNCSPAQLSPGPLFNRHIVWSIPVSTNSLSANNCKQGEGEETKTEATMKTVDSRKEYLPVTCRSILHIFLLTLLLIWFHASDFPSQWPEKLILIEEKTYHLKWPMLFQCTSGNGFCYLMEIEFTIVQLE